MKNHVITTTQLRGMIKEALEESMQEIAIDEQITALRAKGSRRSLQETKQYRRLLEMKMEGMDELAMGEEEQMEPQPEISGMLPHVKTALEALENLPSRSEMALGRVDRASEEKQFLALQAFHMSDDNKRDGISLLLKAASWLNSNIKDGLGPQSSEVEGKMLNRTPMDESRRRLVRRSR